MPFHEQEFSPINELLQEVRETPDFSFLNDWRPEGDSSFFPRVNNSDKNSLKLDGEDRQKLRLAIETTLLVDKLLDETGMELTDAGGLFSNSVSIFHKDGQVSAAALPVTTDTQRAMGGFLFANDIRSLPNSKLFIKDLKSLLTLIPGANNYLSWRWWPTKKADRVLHLRQASQLLLAATNSGERNIHHIADLIESRLELSSGKRQPSLSDWQEALLKLRALEDFPKDSIVASISIEEMAKLQPAMAKIRTGFQHRDRLMSAANVALANLTESRIKTHAYSFGIDEFARKLKGKGFARKLISDIVLDYRTIDVDPDAPVTLGEVMDLKAKYSYVFAEPKTVASGVGMIETFLEDQSRLLSYPDLTGSGDLFDEFLSKIYWLYLNQQRPYPVRSQFESLDKLLGNAPEELHLIARDQETVKRIIGSIDSYLDEDRTEDISKALEQPTAEEAKNFFLENPATYQSILSSMGLNALSLEQISGFLAPELTKGIREIELDLAGMKSPLHTYQIFGAQYAFHQKRVLLGDEMGLGKTVTALALAKHLSNEGAKRILVVFPLAILENWRREVLKHTDFIPQVLYGDDFDTSLATWVSEGGLALATFESLQKVNQDASIAQIRSADLVIVDEAHFIKNPDTKRTAAVLPWINSAEHVLLMTGTPLENTLEEFETLISYVQPHLPIPEDKLAYSKFRQAIAPAYLRRNQVDVLGDLPTLQDTEEYIELSETDIEYYKRALSNNDWHQSRRAKVLAGNKSSTVQRIQDIVEESVANGHKVLIFSFYRETIDVLRNCLSEDDPYLPLTGDLNSLERQNEVDKFTKAKKPGVLLAQAIAGGSGLNIQAASVVIIVEPQTKPSLEEQMLRRAYRMGQTKPVQVMRLRGKNTLDERWVRTLEGKRKIFAATAGISDANTNLDGLSGAVGGNLLKEEQKAWGVHV